MSFGEELKGHDAKFEGTPRCFRSRIEHDPISDTRSILEVVRTVTAEIKCVSSHPILSAQLRGEEAACSDRMEAHAVGVIGKHTACAQWIKPRLEILHEVKALRATMVAVGGICGRPFGCNYGMSISHATIDIADLTRKSRKELPYPRAVVGSIPPVDIVKIHATKVSRTL